MAGYLLDTHVLLWLMEADPRLSASAHRILKEDAEFYVSMASLWEMGIKMALGKLHPKMDEVIAAMTAFGMQLLPISVAHTRVVATLPHHHRDPFDRMLIAQGMAERLPILTGDSQLKPYDVTVIDVLA